MKTRFQKIGDFVDRMIYGVGVMFLMTNAFNHWPRPAAFAFAAFLTLLAGFYVWRFMIRPFRAGLRGEHDPAA